MKKLHFRLLYMVMVVMLLLVAVALAAATREGDIQKPNQIWLLLAPLIATIITSYGVRLFKWLGIPIEEHLLYPILIKLIELIAQVEEDYSDRSGSEKKIRVKEKIISVLKPKEIKLLEGRFGNIDSAIQAAFEMSTTASKGRK